ncbi:response regulator [Pseudothauera rhizosphaerae]|nr:response regulator transcription factor [Pseudothauera rhizosphaerae]
MTRVLVVDDHTLFRQGLHRLLADVPDLEMAGEASTAAQALAMIRAQPWDLVLLDIRLPDAGGLEVLRQLRAEGRDVPVLMLTMYPAERFAAQAARLGAAGYLSKDCSAHHLVEAMRKVAAGGSYIDAHSASDLFFRLARGGGDPPHHLLSRREFEVFIKLAKGHTISQIAADMNVSAKTVSTYRARLLGKLELGNNAEIVRYALAHNLY